MTKQTMEQIEAIQSKMLDLLFEIRRADGTERERLVEIYEGYKTAIEEISK